MRSAHTKLVIKPLIGDVQQATDLEQTLLKGMEAVNEPYILRLKLVGNTWAPLKRWARGDSRILKPITQTNRVSTWDVASLAEIHGLKPIKWQAAKLTPFKTNFLPIWFRELCRKLPLIQSLAYDIEMYFFYDGISRSAIQLSQQTRERISLILPARNESGNHELICNAIAEIDQSFEDVEIVLVEGNSTDDTYIVLEEIVKTYRGNAKLSLVKQDGKGKKDAVIKGFKEATGEWLAIIDTDFTVDIKDSIKAIKHASRLRYCFLNCSRLVYPMEARAMRWANYIGNRFFAIFISQLLSQNVSDSLCGTKVLSRGLYEAMLADGTWNSKIDPFGDFTLLFGASRHGYKIINYPVHYKARLSGEPNISRWIDGLKLINVCFQYLKFNSLSN
jgi:hypothetical protein